MAAVIKPVWANEMGPLNKKLRLAVIYIQEPPYIYTDDNSGYVGVLPKLAQALSRELELELTYLPTPRKDLEKSVIEGRADMTWLSPNWVGAEDLLLFSDPVLLHREFLYSFSPFNEGDGPRGWLQDKTVCIRQDYAYPNLMPYFDSGVAQGLRVSGQVSLVKLFQKGRCDVLYMNELRAAWMINKLGIKRKVWRSEFPIEEAKLSFAFSQQWQTKMTLINQAVAKIKSSGELSRIVESSIDPIILSNLSIE